MNDEKIQRTTMNLDLFCFNLAVAMHEYEKATALADKVAHKDIQLAQSMLDDIERAKTDDEEADELDEGKMQAKDERLMETV